MKVRAARLEDAHVVADIFVRSARIEFPETLPASWLERLSVEAEAKTYAKLIESEDSTVFVAESEEGVIGYAVSAPVSVPDRVPSDTYPGEVMGIFILRSGQRHGWGRALIRAVAEDMLERGRQGMVVYTQRENGAARRFYEKLGAVAIDEITRDFDGVDVVEIGYGWSDLRQLVVPA